MNKECQNGDKDGSFRLDDDVDSIDRVPVKDYAHNPKSSDDSWGIILSESLKRTNIYSLYLFPSFEVKHQLYAQKKKKYWIFLSDEDQHIEQHYIFLYGLINYSNRNRNCFEFTSFMCMRI